MTKFGILRKNKTLFCEYKNEVSSKVNISKNKGGDCMLQIKSHQFQVTEAMQEVATQRFNFLNPEELNHLRLKIETLNPHRLRIKAIYQKSKQKPFVMEVLTSDFYQ